MIRISLFWRTFVLIAGLVAISLATLLLLLRFVDSAPPEQRLAWEVASIVNLTRSALVSSQPERRITLLRELANEEGIRVLPLEPTDEIELSQQTGRVALLAPRLQNLLGPQTLVVPRVNKQDGLWISFNIDADKYWLQMQSRRIDRHFGPSFGTIASLVAGLALLGSLALSRLVNKPLADLSRAISALRRGERPARLNENLASELAQVNRRFNAMTADLLELEQDRALTLAGISHDIRSPLARMRMEAEMAALDEDTRESFVEDIERIDTIVGRFIDFARANPSAHVAAMDVNEVLAELPQVYRNQVQAGELVLDIVRDKQVTWVGDSNDLERTLSNLIDNAWRYGRVPRPDSDVPQARVEVRATRQPRGMLLQVRDHGPGVPEEQLTRLLRPFARLDTARGETEGAGLGLAIVDRMARRYDGSFTLANAPGGGLVATLFLPDAVALAERAPA